MNRENLFENFENLIKYYNLPSFINFQNTKGNGFVAEKISTAPMSCRFCFLPATRERLPTPALVCIC